MSSFLESRKVGDVLVVCLKRARILDEAVIQPLGKELLETVQDANGGKLLLNFEEVEYMSSAMLGKLIYLSKQCRAENIDLKMCCISSEIKKIFAMMKLNQMLDIQRDEAAALRAFAEERTE